MATGYIHDLIRYKDQILHKNGRIFAFHKNKNDDLDFDKEWTSKNLKKTKITFTTLKKSHFGTCVCDHNLEENGTPKGTYPRTSFKAFNIKSSKKSKQHCIDVFCCVEQEEDGKIWMRSLKNQMTVYYQNGYEKHKNASKLCGMTILAAQLDWNWSSAQKT